MHGYQLFLQELQETTFNREVERARERWMYEMYDIGQVRQIREMFEQLTPKPRPEKMYPFHEYAEDSHFGTPEGRDGWNR